MVLFMLIWMICDTDH
ncbi:Protein of unknown function [Lactobacillus helveticus CIRM-BIA 953]|uniref:Uncharacterized protein n=1 Tax=Lactobacillus helveticus CIRM-BIA 953 TaxID=1226335 RepID=U4QMI6_LACHE|nr:Protein of unknown function [Lactobacillus helveticus CIRM-BIA 953]